MDIELTAVVFAVHSNTGDQKGCRHCEVVLNIRPRVGYGSSAARRRPKDVFVTRQCRRTVPDESLNEGQSVQYEIESKPR